MRASFIAGAGPGRLLEGSAPQWAQAAPLRLALTGTPLALQPAAYIQTAWRERPIGATRSVRVSALHDGATLAFRLEWDDATEDGRLADDDRFPDAAAVLLRGSADAPLISMGAPGAPVTAWYWRADEAGAREIVAEGIGSSRTIARDSVQATGGWKDGRWQLVLARALESKGRDAVAQLHPGQTIGFGIAVWEGGRAERAGLKSYSGPSWQELTIGAVPEPGRQA